MGTISQGPVKQSFVIDDCDGQQEALIDTTMIGSDIAAGRISDAQRDDVLNAAIKMSAALRDLRGAIETPPKYPLLTDFVDVCDASRLPQPQEVKVDMEALRAIYTEDSFTSFDWALPVWAQSSRTIAGKLIRDCSE